ncbi:MAG TPA: DUF5690 family protein [Chitinophagaceae bacterium]|nr:DUF5690 family protein [Chitinophagaceae bacterium]
MTQSRQVSSGSSKTFGHLSRSLYAALVAFLTYASVYAYRKPFTVASFDGIHFWGVPYQTLLVIAQVFGYMASKFFGIKFIAELKRLGRWKTSAVLIAIAWLALLAFALTPPPYGMIFLFINGFPLGFLWGIVFSYVEGRRATDFIGTAMAVSFIFAGGFTRSVAIWIRDNWHVPDAWIGFMTGLVFLLPLALFIFLLEKIKAPDAGDIAERTERLPMNKESRQRFLREFGFGLLLVTVTYVFLTVMRDVRDNFMANMWTELGYGNDYSIFTSTETITSVVVMLLMSLLVLIRKNIIAFRIIHIVIMGGFLLAGFSSWQFIHHRMEGAVWMQLTGLGLYLGYIPFNCIFFERLIASFRIAGNVGFLIYFADAFGYLGSVAVILGKTLFDLKLNWSSFYSEAVLGMAFIGIAGTISSFFYFNKKYAQKIKA